MAALRESEGCLSLPLAEGGQGSQAELGCSCAALELWALGHCHSHTALACLLSWVFIYPAVVTGETHSDRSEERLAASSISLTKQGTIPLLQPYPA